VARNPAFCYYISQYEKGEDDMPDEATTLNLPEGVAVSGALKPGYERVLTAEALDFVAALARRFEQQRR
jgi:malate synthase